MLKFLKGVVGGSGTGPRDLPYNIGDPYPSAWGSWTHFRGSSKVALWLILSVVVFIFLCVYFNSVDPNLVFIVLYGIF